MKSFAQEVIVVDIGNTSTHVALYRGIQKLKEFRAPAKNIKINLLFELKKRFKADHQSPVVIASVSPETTRVVSPIFQSVYGVRPLLVGKDLQVPIVNRYKNPKQVGVDRLLNAYAGYCLYQKEMLILDFGTAITVDIVSKKGEYLGGVIAPGIEISLEALFQKTALLPRIRLAHPKTLIGRDTTESIRVGCTVGIGGLCDRIVESLIHRYQMKPVVIATGGYAFFMKRYCHSLSAIHPDLVLQGIARVYLARTKQCVD